MTGGEPLAQPNALPHMTRLADLGCEVSSETSGALDLSKWINRVVEGTGFKNPASGEMSRNLLSNSDYLTPHDQIKFVICNHDDYVWAKQQVEQYQLNKKVEYQCGSPLHLPLKKVLSSCHNLHVIWHSGF